MSNPSDPTIDTTAEKPPQVIAAEATFSEFLEKNPLSSIEMAEEEAVRRLRILKPWGENALTIYIPDDPTELADALNNLILPEQFTAIWHADTQEFEVIWTAFKLVEPFHELRERKFKFGFEGNDYECEFGRSSDRLLTIASHSLPVGVSSTSHRNLYSFKLFAEQDSSRSSTSENAPLSKVGNPKSFWIRGLQWDEEKVLRFVKHLNFYLTYYDNVSPSLLIHSPPPEVFNPRTRYIIGEFPNRIDSREIDEILLQLWAAAQSSDGRPVQKYIYLYRILEYSSHAYIEREIRDQVRRVLSSPHALNNINALADEVISATLASKGEEYSRPDRLLRDAVNPQLLWREIANNPWAFNQKTVFDGGFELDPLIGPNAKEEDFAATGMASFHRLSRNIRNHLSHGRDKTTQASIAPTRENFRRLEPWVSVLSVAVGEIINFRHIM